MHHCGVVSGKPLKDHQEFVGHAQAIVLMNSLLDHHDLVTEDDLFLLHRAVQSSIVTDIYQPIGAWKQEPNGTHALTATGKHTFIDYAAPVDVYLQVDCARTGHALLPKSKLRDEFKLFCKDCWQASLTLVTEIRIRQ